MQISDLKFNADINSFVFISAFFLYAVSRRLILWHSKSDIAFPIMCSVGKTEIARHVHAIKVQKSIHPQSHEPASPTIIMNTETFKNFFMSLYLLIFVFIIRSFVSDKTDFAISSGFFVVKFNILR